MLCTLGLLVGLAPVLASAASVPEYDGGRSRGEVAPDDAARRGLTIVDLSDEWAPSPFGAGVEYRETLISLANQTSGYYELLGVAPSFSVVRARLEDEPRHLCHDAVDDSPLAGDGPEAVRAAQEHLVCEGLLPHDAVDGRLGPGTLAALRRYRLRYMLPGGSGLDDETRELLAQGSRELDYRALLRTLRERVADATGLIEDGSARGEQGRVLGRLLDSGALRPGDGWPPLERAAPDEISPATEAAAIGLGWTSPEAARVALAHRPAAAALRLPPLPAYHTQALSLYVVIDKGHVRRGEGRERASLVLYAVTSDGPLALVRWPTTIGGWQDEKLPGGEIVRRYKNSRPGDYVWRDIVVAPTWFAPPSTPDQELVRRSGDGWALRQDTIGPGYRSAYGLVMLMHHRAVVRRSGEIDYEDTEVRTHGTVNYTSVNGGFSHGCHRLYNHLALRLVAFLLRHQPHDELGVIHDHYERRVYAGGQSFVIRRASRGYAIRLRQPVPVRILERRVH